MVILCPSPRVGANNRASGAAIKESSASASAPTPGPAPVARIAQGRSAGYAASDAPIITTPLAVSTTSTTRRKAVALRPR